MISSIKKKIFETKRILNPNILFYRE